jgi:ribosomal protein S18 acetylase RimI-like enzyme
MHIQNTSPVPGRKPESMTLDYQTFLDKYQIWIAHQNEDPIAFVMVLLEEDTLLIYSIATAPEHQGMGLGGHLMNHCERQAVEKGHHQIRLYTNEMMTRNLALYSELGYLETHREPLGSSTVVSMGNALKRCTYPSNSVDATTLGQILF